MRNSLLILAFSSFFITANAQSDWAFHVSAEETVTNGDSKSTLNFLSFTQLAANSGMRAGFYYTKDNSLAAEITLGVVGTSRTDEWFTKIVPIEIVGHYNIVPLINNSSPYKFNADLGIGSGLVRAHSDTYNANGRFGFSEHLSAGASLDIPVKDLAILSFGLRNTWFIDDYIDATPVDGTGNDQMLRFFTATRVNLGPSAKFKSELAEAKSMANSLSNDLTQAKADAQAAEEKNETLKKKMDAAAKAHDEEVAQLTDALSACKDSLNNENDTEQVVNSSNLKGYYVIIGSLPSEELALKHMSRLGLSDLQIIHMKDLNTYRVVYSKHDNKTDAVNSRRKARSIRRDAWIAVY